MRPVTRLLLAVVVAGGCGSLDQTSPATPGGFRELPAPTPAPGSSLAIALDKLDPSSRALADLIDPDEIVDARIDTGDAVNVLGDVRAGGGTAHLVSDTIVLTRAPFEVVVAALTRIDVASGSIAEDLRAGRHLPAALPDVSVGGSGNPYADMNLALDVGVDAVAIPPVRLQPMLAALRGGIQTFDGRPYRALAFDGTCGPESCDLTATGSVESASPDATDVWAVHAAAVNGWVPTAGPGDRQLFAIPRRVARAAEWIARSQPELARRIATYDRIGGFAWEPGDPILIRIDYQRACPGGAAPAGAGLASDKVCLDTLDVVVDVRSGAVVDIVERKIQT